MKFIVRPVPNRADDMEVRYECPCGCKPRARYTRGTTDSGHEHCCCGRVHFVGTQAESHLRSYLEVRRTTGEDTGKYKVTVEKVESPWGEDIPVAFGLPRELHKH